jgi:hypothetical protein
MESKIINDYKAEQKKPKLTRRERRKLMRLLKKGKGIKKTINKRIDNVDSI